MDKSTSINHCTSSISTVREECQRANSEFMYKTCTMQYLAETHLSNSTTKLTNSGCFFIKKDEIHCSKCHTSTLCTKKLSESYNQTMYELLQQPECCIHRLHTRECTSYAEWSNALNLPAPRFPLSAGANAGAGINATPQNQVTNRQNASGATATRPNTSLPIPGAQVAVSSTPTLNELRTAISVNHLPWSIDRPAYPLCTTPERRMRTFANWPPTSPNMSRTLTRTGFLYTGREDKVCCAYCGIMLKNWTADDDPFAEHARWRPECAWLIQQKGQTFIDKVYKLQQEFNLGAPKTEYNTTDKASHPTFDSASARLTTFKNDNLCSIKKSYQITSAGFLLITETDQLCCFFCNGKIKEWRNIQCFLSVHRHNYPDCQFIKGLYSPLESVDNLATSFRDSVNLS